LEVAVSICWKHYVRILLIVQFSEEEDPDEYPFPLTLRTKRSTGPTSPNPEAVTNGGGV
jgi:hypothetical protein